MISLIQGLIVGALAVLFVNVISNRERSDRARSMLRDLSARSSLHTSGATDFAFSAADRVLDAVTTRFEHGVTAFRQTKVGEERRLYEELSQAKLSGRLDR